jgi:hypothetical protein
MKTKIILFIAILFATTVKAQFPIQPGNPGNVLTSAGAFGNPYWGLGGDLLDTVTLNLNTTTPQGFKMPGYTGSQYVITNMIITNATATPTSAKGGEWWVTKGKTSGTQIMRTLKQVTSVFTYLNTDTAYLDHSNSNLLTVYPLAHPFILIRDSIYFFCDTVNGSALQVTDYIYGKRIR